MQKYLTSSHGKIDISIIGLFDVVRDVSVELVETIVIWQRTQISYPNDVKAFLWNGTDYLEKMSTDSSFLKNYPEISSWLGFTPSNPFLVPPEVCRFFLLIFCIHFTFKMKFITFFLMK